MSTVGNTMTGLVSALFGFSSVYTNEALIQTLSKPEYLGSVELSDLKKKVVIAAFDVSPPEGNTWEPRAFTNLLPVTGRVTNAVDAAVSSSASPIMMPIHNGFVDGALFANNPSMVAAATIVAATRQVGSRVENHPDLVPDASADVRQMYMLSIAGGRFAPNLKVENASWGYLQWMAQLTNPLLALNMFFQSGMQAVDFQGQYLFAPNTYHRVDPDYVVQQVGLPWLQANPNDLIVTANSPQAEAEVELAVAWLDAVGWLDE
jgi:patatin-like phospholipase/acyl hydrolase